MIYYIYKKELICDMAFTFEIEEHIADLRDERTSDGFMMELNLVSFNNRKAKYDIRAWDEKHEIMRKGISLTDEEVKALKDALNSLDI